MMWAGTSLPHSNADGLELGTLSIRFVHVSDIAKAPFLLIAFGETIKKTSSLLQVKIGYQCKTEYKPLAQEMVPLFQRI